MHNAERIELCGFIEHTLLSQAATEGQIIQLCDQAKKQRFAAVCVNPRWVSLAADKLHGSRVKICSVVSFPLGTDSTKIKAMQAKDAIFAGADEIDMVADLAAIIGGDTRYLTNELKKVLKVCRSMRPRVLLKVIIESAALTGEQKIFACQIAQKVGVDFIKTSTGFHSAGGANVEDVRLIKRTAPTCKVKAAGGIKTAAQALALIEAGAERIGTSSGMAIVNEADAERV